MVSGGHGRMMAAQAGAVLLLAALVLAEPDWPTDVHSSLEDGDSYEYIVVGAGAAGSAAASRLALAGHSVLLVEAGGNPDLLTRIPGTAPSLLASDMDWAYPTVPNNYSCLASEGKNCRWSRGYCLGGSTSINYMMYVRGNPTDFDDWDVSGWTWDEMMPYFLRYEGLQDLAKLPNSSEPYHNESGILKVEFFTDSENTWHDRLFEGYESLALLKNEDVNAETQIGVSQVLGYVYDGERESTARAYLTDDDVKAALQVAKYTKCTGVVIDENNNATGITVITGLRKRNLTLYATKEVILSAGAVGTPQILLLSGVGPADHLEDMNITVKADLPVGEDLSDHVLALMLLKVDRGFGVDAPNLFVYGAIGVQAVQWLATKDGPLASNGLTDVTAFMNTTCYDSETKQLLNDTGCDIPTTQFIHAYIDRDIIPGAKDTVQKSLGFEDYVVDQISDANINNALIVVSTVVLRTESRGYLQLNASDPYGNPAIYANYLEDSRDVDELIRAITVVQDLVETDVFQANNASLLYLTLDGCEDYENGTEEYWRCYVERITYSVYHTVGSTALGSVLDERLCVLGVGRLRVADLGVAPLLPRGNTEALAVAIGERVADFIAEDNS